VLHHEKMEIIILVDVVSPHDGGMVERRDRARFPVKSLESGRVVRPRRGQDLDRSTAAHELMLAEIDLAHAAGGDKLQDLVLADGKPAPLALQKLLGLEMG